MVLVIQGAVSAKSSRIYYLSKFKIRQDIEREEYRYSGNNTFIESYNALKVYASREYRRLEVSQ